MSNKSPDGAGVPVAQGPPFEDGDDVVLRAHPESQLFAIIGKAEIPSVEGEHYFGRAENGGVVLLRAADIMLAPAPEEGVPAFVSGEPVCILSTAFPGWAPVGSTGIVNDVSRGVVYVRMTESAHVIPFDPKDLQVVHASRWHGRLGNLSDQVAQ
ncbi:hypothetical protein [Lentzea sp. NEAU-D7]|uniref:hypothetical protein n=1 Tax=Lentzea sp. NEAU-D7 TaxID=2994667 RepID=UPI00224A4FD1|nr:hypothetical protein [Lentzea sp. NEAU-D7]MCX2949909.1 hypothetical protein [Lentzea sp. NEAU-D7]